jgi:hypothetical protein
MENILTVTTFIGWCAVLNLGMYVFTALILTVLREPVKKIHSKLSGLSPEKLDEAYFNYLANYKLALIVLNIVPYVALKLLAS